MNEKYRWKLTEFYANEEAFAKDTLVLVDEVEKFVKLRGQIGLCADNLLYALTSFSNILGKASYILSYGTLLIRESNSAVNNMVGATCSSIYNGAIMATSFISTEICDISDETLEKYFKVCGEPLTQYRQYVADVRKKQCGLSEFQLSKIIMAKSNIETAREMHKILISGDLPLNEIIGVGGEIIKLTPENLYLYVNHEAKEVATQAIAAHLSMYEKSKNIFIYLLNKVIENRKEIAYLYGYKSAFEYSLVESGVTLKLYDAMSDKIKTILPYKNKKTDLLMEREGITDINIFTKFNSSEVKIPFKFEEAIAIIRNSILILGDDYVNRFDRGLESNWVDAFPREGKHPRSVCRSTNGIHPFVCINYNGDDSQ